MAAPLLVVDTPSMLYRAFFALPKTIKGAGGSRSTRCSAPPTWCSARSRSTSRGRSCSASAPRPPTTGSSSTPATTPTAPRCRSCSYGSGQRAGDSSRPSAGGSTARDARGRRPARLAGRGRDRGRREDADHDRRPRHVPMRERDVTVLYPRRAFAAWRPVGPAEVRSALRDRPRAGARLHRPARRSLRRDPGREGHRREDRRRAAAQVREPRRACSTRALEQSTPRIRGALRDGREQLLAYREMATLQDAERRAGPPTRRPTGQGAPPRPPSGLGMNRLAERLGRRERRRRVNRSALDRADAPPLRQELGHRVVRRLRALELGDVAAIELEVGGAAAGHARRGA